MASIPSFQSNRFWDVNQHQLKRTTGTKTYTPCYASCTNHLDIHSYILATLNKLRSRKLPPPQRQEITAALLKISWKWQADTSKTPQNKERETIKSQSHDRSAVRVNVRVFLHRYLRFSSSLRHQQARNQTRSQDFHRCHHLATH